MNQITTRYVTENGACYEQYVITDAEAKTELVITPERGGMITGFSLNGEEYIWTRHPNFSECNRPRFGVPVLFPNCGLPDNGVHIFDGKAYPMENHGFADLCAWDVESVGPDGVTLILESTPLTKFLYPFDFTLLLNYNLEGNTALVSLKFKNGAIGVIDNCRKASYGYDQRLEVFGSKAQASAANDPPTHVAFIDENGKVTDKPLYFFLERYMQSFTDEMTEFIDCVLHDKPTKTTVEDGLQALRMGLAAKKSLAEHRPVKLSEIEA